MRLYTICKTCRYKVYISSSAKTRLDLPVLFYLTCPNLHQHEYHPKDIFAETSVRHVALGSALIGGLVGSIAGRISGVVGTILGGLLGLGSERQDSDDVLRFNES